MAASSSFQEQPIVHDFHHVDERPIQFDIWSQGSKSSPKPAIIFFHGGKLVGLYAVAGGTFTTDLPIPGSA
jgi:hypothetical protein